MSNVIDLPLYITIVSSDPFRQHHQVICTAREYDTILSELGFQGRYPSSRELLTMYKGILEVD